jgi:hypothetical protein
MNCFSPADLIGRLESFERTLTAPTSSLFNRGHASDWNKPPYFELVMARHNPFTKVKEIRASLEARFFGAQTAFVSLYHTTR